jgi:hypothetical protein
VKNLKDHWVAYNKHVSLFNQIYNQESLNRQIGADDDMVLEIANQRYKNWSGAEFKRFHWWKVVKYQPKWRAMSDAPSTINAFVSSSEAATEEDVTRLIDWDRAKTVVWKEKGKEDSSNQSGSSSAMGDIMSSLKKLATLFIRTQMWKQYNKLCEVNTATMNVEELVSYWEALKVIKKDLNFVSQNVGDIMSTLKKLATSFIRA